MSASGIHVLFILKSKHRDCIGVEDHYKKEIKGHWTYVDMLA